MTPAEAAAQAALEAQGYFVFCHNRPLPPNAPAWTFEGVPYGRVIGPSTEQEFLQQLEQFGPDRVKEMHAKAKAAGETLYYSRMVSE